MNRSYQIKMKTSAYQFEVMVTFMEEHGDLCRQYLSAKERLVNLNKWEELTTVLNCDVSGDSKNSSKWKKVWADLKNNTKKKFIRIQRSSTQGGPVVHAKMTELEQRVINLMGLQIDTQMTVEVEEPGSSSHDEEPVEKKPLEQYTCDPLRHQNQLKSPDHTYTTSQAPQKPFSNEKWRHFKLQQHKDYLELKREQNRIREMEVQAQLGWQQIGNRAIDLLDKIVNKYCKDIETEAE